MDDLAAAREAESLAAFQKEAEELAAATLREEKRIAAEKEIQRANKAKFAQIEKDKEEAYRAQLQKEHEERLAIERENDAKQIHIAAEAQRQEALKKTQEDRKFLEEQEKKRLADSLLPKGNADIVPKHPLARFLQHAPE